LVEAGHEVPLVVTQPDRPAGRGLRTLGSAVKLAAGELGLDVYQPERIKDPAAVDRIREAGADLHLVVAYGQIIPPPLLAVPRLGTVNVHASLLPRHRGAAPIVWAILSGDSQTGVTIMQMDVGLDTGPILAREATPIAPDETAGSLESRLAERGADLLVTVLPGLANGAVHPEPQPAEGATYARRLTSEDGKLDQRTMSALELDRRVRALTPQPGCWLTLDGTPIKVLAGHVADGRAETGLPVATVGGTYIVEEVQPPGGRPMAASAWARGRR
jgi:methionyl-tRNA formyltransferase